MTTTTDIDSARLRRDCITFHTAWAEARERTTSVDKAYATRTTWLRDAVDMLSWPSGPSAYHESHRRLLADALDLWADQRDIEDAAADEVDQFRRSLTRFLRDTAALIRGEARLYARRHPVEPLRLIWPTIVGESLALASHPVAIAGDTLIIVTASAEHSHQLAMIETDLVRRIRVHDVPGIRRLRFRVGRQRQSDPKPIPALSSSASGPSELQHLRRVIERESGDDALSTVARFSAWVEQPDAFACAEAEFADDERHRLFHAFEAGATTADANARFDHEDASEIARLALWLIAGHDAPAGDAAREVIDVYLTGVRAPQKQLSAATAEREAPQGPDVGAHTGGPL